METARQLSESPRDRINPINLMASKPFSIGVVGRLDKFYVKNILPSVKNRRGATRLHIELLKRALPELQPRRHPDGGYKFQGIVGATPQDFTPIVCENAFFREWINTVEDGDIVVDVGAHNATYSLFVKHLAETVYAFEMDGNNAAAAQVRVQKNYGNNIKIVWKAVAEQVGQKRAETGCGGESRLTETGDTVVDTVSLDAFFADRDDPDVVKMDIEGMELAALRGAEAVIERNHPTFFIEVHEGFANSDHTVQDVKRVLRDHGYAVETLMTMPFGERIKAT